MVFKLIIKTVSFSLLFMILLSGCGKPKGPNPVLYYMKNSNLTYDNKMQRDNIFDAMKDILYLSKDDLKMRRYKDASGYDHKWDLKTLVIFHFKPKQPGLPSLDDDDFYDYVKEDSVKSIASYILITY
jgi:hypothetical protein